MTQEAPFVYYYQAKQMVYEKGYFQEIYFQETVDLKSLSKADFYKEYAWVVLSSGMKERVIKQVFVRLSIVFNNWKNPNFIVQNKTQIFNQAISIFNNRLKVFALLEMAEYLSKKSITYVINKIKEAGPNYLMSFKFLGPATSYHLAKNIGIDIAKPDRHLVRIANLFGYNCPNVLCQTIASVTGDKKSVIDIVLWRYATLNRNYLAFKYA